MVDFVHLIIDKLLLSASSCATKKNTMCPPLQKQLKPNVLCKHRQFRPAQNFIHPSDRRNQVIHSINNDNSKRCGFMINISGIGTVTSSGAGGTCFNYSCLIAVHHFRWRARNSGRPSSSRSRVLQHENPHPLPLYMRISVHFNSPQIT